MRITEDIYEYHAYTKATEGLKTRMLIFINLKGTKSCLTTCMYKRFQLLLPVSRYWIRIFNNFKKIVNF